jgi:PAS domain S-box-containing protein
VRRFTPAATRAFALTSKDIGRGIGEIAPRFRGVDLARLLDEVGKAGAKREVEVSVEGRAYLLRVLPHCGGGAAVSGGGGAAISGGGGAAISDGDGAVIMGAVVTVIDVDALKTARQRVRDLDRRNQTVIESLSETIVSWDPNSERILFSNGAFAQTVDLGAEELVGRPLAAVLHPEVYRHKRSAMAALETRPFVTSLVRAPKPSGEIVWRSMRYTRVTGFDGSLTAYLACGRDVSDQMRYIEALEALARVQTPIDQPFESFAAEALKIGAGLLGAPHAALARAGERRRVVCLVSRDKPPAEALCERALAQAQEIARRPDDAVAELPAEAELAACVGAPVRLGAEIYGAVCFFSPEAPAFGPLTEFQRSFVRHVAQWIGMKIEIHRQHLSLRRSEGELRLIFDNVSQNIWRLDRSHRVRWANAGAAQAMGLEPESVVGAPADAFMKRLDPKWRAHGEAAFGAQTPYYGVEAEFRQQGEAPQWTSTDFTPDNEGPEGEPSLLVVSSDITQMKEREAELELAIADADHTRRLYQRHYRRTPVLLCSFQSDGRVVEASDLWLDKTGYDREEVVGRRLGEFMDEPSRLHAQTQALPALWRTGACEAVPLRFVAKSGVAMDFELSGFRSAEDGGAPLCLAVLVDVTARNAAETALERANRDLAVVNDGLKKFAHVASHDLQEPLRKIRQFGDLLISEHRQALSGDAALYVDVMRDSAERMRQLIRDILDFSRSINATMSRTRLPLAEIARDILSELDMAVQEAGAEVGIGPLPSLLGDRIAVQMLMRNLIGNSLKYRRPGVAPQLSVSGAWKSEAEYVLSFKDNGRGVDPRHHDVIFDAFTRLHPHGEAHGSGLGLAICKSVCERQQWRIELKSAPDEGAEFTIAIPAADVVSDADRKRRG